MLNLPNILDTDSYKASHFLQYPPGTQGMHSYLEARSGAEDSHVLFFGLQYLMMEYLRGAPFGNEPLRVIREASDFFHTHGLPFNRSGFERIAKLGYLPIRIRAVPEGLRVPVDSVLMTVESTDPETFWIVNYLETMFCRLWYPTTVATKSWETKLLIYSYLEETADDPDNEILFKLHDFGSRGVTCREQAAIGGAAHLVNFRGSDTVAGVWLANKYYHCDMAGFSIPAAEHSTITSWGQNREVEAYKNMLDQFADPGKMVAVVSDSYDLYNAVEHIWGEILRQDVIKSGATVVIRPDSGDPETVVLKTLILLHEKFGCTVNTKGYNVLNNVRVIQGDGVDYAAIQRILVSMRRAGYSASNIAFGMGGALLQKMNRDTESFAFKCSAINIDGEWKPVCKSPKTDGTKSSKAGRLDLQALGKTVQTVALKGDEPPPVTTLMRDVFLNGEILIHDSLADIRARAALSLKD